MRRKKSRYDNEAALSDKTKEDISFTVGDQKWLKTRLDLQDEFIEELIGEVLKKIEELREDMKVVTALEEKISMLEAKVA